MYFMAVENGGKEQQDYLQQLAKEVLSRISEQYPAHSKELISDFAAELFRSAAEQEQQKARGQKQIEGIEAAKKRGVRFGRRRLPVPDGFVDLAQLWKSGGISAVNAAAELGMSRDTFLRRAKEYREAV